MPWNVGALQLSQLTEGTAVVDAGVLSPSSAWGHPPTLLTVAHGPCLLLGTSGQQMTVEPSGSAQAPVVSASPRPVCLAGRPGQDSVRQQALGGWRVNLRTSFSALEFVLNLIHTEIKCRLVGLRFPWQGAVASGTPASSPSAQPRELGLWAGWPLGWPGLLAGGRAVGICPHCRAGRSKSSGDQAVRVPMAPRLLPEDKDIPGPLAAAPVQPPSCPWGQVWEHV